MVMMEGTYAVHDPAASDARPAGDRDPGHPGDPSVAHAPDAPELLTRRCASSVAVALAACDRHPEPASHSSSANAPGAPELLVGSSLAVAPGACSARDRHPGNPGDPSAPDAAQLPRAVPNRVGQGIRRWRGCWGAEPGWRS